MRASKKKRRAFTCRLQGPQQRFTTAFWRNFLYAELIIVIVIGIVCCCLCFRHRVALFRNVYAVLLQPCRCCYCWRDFNEFYFLLFPSRCSLLTRWSFISFFNDFFLTCHPSLPSWLHLIFSLFSFMMFLMFLNSAACSSDFVSK